MGQLARSDIVLQGLSKAGRKDLTTRATEALRNWLRSQYKAWPFSFLRQSREGLSLPAGTTSLKIGTGEGGIAGEVQRVLNPIWIYDSIYSTRTKANIVSLDSQSLDDENRIVSASLVRGIPQGFKLRTARTTSGAKICKAIIPNPVPDKAYLLTFDYIEIPLDPIPADATYPDYPNDQTMVAFIELFALNWAMGKDDAAYQIATSEVAAQVMRDRINDGHETGTNDSIGLDPTNYPT